MLMTTALIALVILVLAFSAGFLWRRRAGPQQSYARDERARMPREIAEGKLVLSEFLLKTSDFVSRVDQVYDAPLCGLVPTENKTRDRARIYPSDVVELSVQARCLRRAAPPHLQGIPVAAYGYVRASGPFGVRWLRTALLDDERLDRLVARYRALRAGGVAPRGAARAGLCRQCGQRSRCPHPQSRGGRTSASGGKESIQVRRA